MTKFSSRKVWKRIFDKAITCPECGSSDLLVYVEPEDSKGDVECRRCGHSWHQYSKKQMKDLGYE